MANTSQKQQKNTSIYTQLKFILQLIYQLIINDENYSNYSFFTPPSETLIHKRIDERLLTLLTVPTIFQAQSNFSNVHI